MSNKLQYGLVIVCFALSIISFLDHHPHLHRVALAASLISMAFDLRKETILLTMPGTCL